MSRLRAEHLLPLACAGACAMLGASEFMDTFVLNGPGPTPQVVQTAVDQHHYALLVLAGFALVALAIAVVAGSKPAATAVAVCGAGALLIFLLIDLPDAGRVDTIANFTEAKAEPATGFWLQLAGALVLAICGGALATLRPDQLRAFARTVEGARPSARWRPSGAGGNPGDDGVEGEPENERPRKPSRSGDAAESAKRAH
ncbi:MAG: hypothetical protein ACRDKV_00400 [Solirubrobacterales bacterium]